MLCVSRGPEWTFSSDCWPMLQIFAEEVVILALMQALEDTTYKNMARWSVTEITGTLTWLKEELCKHLRFHCSCCKIRRNHRRTGTVTLGQVHIWHWSQQMPREEYGSRGSTRKVCPSQPPSSLSPPQGHCLLRAAQQRQSRDCFTNPCGTLAGSTSLFYLWDTVPSGTFWQGKPWDWLWSVLNTKAILIARDIPRRGWRGLQLPSLVEQLPTPRLS